MNRETPKQLMPDVAYDAAPHARTLDWVGMEGIALPLVLADGWRVPAKADIFVRLEDASARGIHMSRLFLRLQDAIGHSEVLPALLDGLLADAIASQQGLGQAARVVLHFSQMLLRPALATGHAGWRDYPVTLIAERDGDAFHCSVEVELLYSSTCPASAALSRQVVAGHFIDRFPEGGSGPEIAAWLATPEGMAATPHAQRSRANLRLSLAPGTQRFPVAEIVEAVETALGTPVQTAVKREDERAFAEANAANLMFCEDAARRIAAVAGSFAFAQRFEARVAHLESLHAHDAVAMVAGGCAGAG